MSERDLEKYFGFNPGDLSANRAGHLSDKQKTKLEQREKSANRILTWAGIVFTLIGLGAAAGIYLQSSAATAGLNQPLNWGETLMGMGIPLFILGIFAAGSFALAGSKVDNSLQSVEGKVNFVKVEKRVSSRSATGSTTYRTVQQYEMRVGNVNFNNVSEKLLDMIEQGDFCAMYYAKDSKHILSAERISPRK